MSVETGLIYDVIRKMLAKYPRFGSEIAVANIEFRDNLPSHTAATDGKNVYVDPNYFKSLSENDRLFIIAHEIMHIKFMHMYRLMDKDGKKRDLKLWNIATDAIINANLKRDGFTIKEGYVNMPESLNYSAEEFYQKLLQEKENKQQEQREGEKQVNQQNSGDYGQGQKQKQDKEQENGQGKDSKNSDEGKSEGDDHSLWEEAFKQQQNTKKKGQEQVREQPEEQKKMRFDEKVEFIKNREEKQEKFMARREQAKRDIRSTGKEVFKIKNIGESKKAIDWKLLLRREIERTETIWSRRHAIAENNYAFRLEENDIVDESETEVMIDVSGSVELDLIKAFLRQIKLILKQSKLKIGCFDGKASNFIEIKNQEDIEEFQIPYECGGDGTDLDLPVRKFTKNSEINKIVFTDGKPWPIDRMPKEDLKRENVIWIVYGNKDFNPCCGKVIQMTEEQLKQLYIVDKSNSAYEISR